MALETSLVSLAFGAGMLASVNPCGFAMLPAYISYHMQTGVVATSIGNNVARGLGAGGLTTLGFASFFLLVGIIFSSIGRLLAPILSWIVVGMAVFMIAIGIVSFFGWHVPLLRLQGISDKIYGKSQKRTTFSFYIFGIGYALASLSCTVPLFVLLVTQALAIGSFLGGLQVFTSYSLGMGLVITIASLGVAFSRQGMIANFRRLMPYVNRIASLAIIVVGFYLIYFHLIFGQLYLLFQ